MDKYFPVYTSVEEVPKTICCKLDERIFNYPFFNEGISYSKLSSSEVFDNVFKEDFAKDDILNINGFIFNVSHCGSTLLCRMLNQVKNIRVVSETEAINGILLSKIFYGLSDEETVSHLRKIVNSYRQNSISKNGVIFKLSSWNVYFINLFLYAFPEVKWIFLDRDLHELTNSLLKADNGFVQWWDHPVDKLRKWFIGTSTEGMNKRDYIEKMIELHRTHALNHKNSASLFLRYPQFLSQYQNILDHLEISASNEEKAASIKMTYYDSKSLEKKPWNTTS